MKDVLVVGERMSQKYAYSKKTDLYDRREDIEMDFNLCIKEFDEASMDYLVYTTLKGAATIGKAEEYMLTEIVELHKAGTKGMALFRTIIERYERDSVDRVDALLAEFTRLERKSNMTLREALYMYDNIVTKMNKADNDCLPSKEVMGKKLLSFVRTADEKHMLFMLAMLDKQSDLDDDKSVLDEDLTEAVLIRDPAKLLKTLRAVARDPLSLLKSFGKEKQQSMAAAAFHKGKGNSRQSDEGGEKKNRNGGKAKNGYQPKGNAGGNKNEVVNDCDKCGRSHPAAMCPAADKVCHVTGCGQLGHFARKCPKKNAKSGGNKSTGQLQKKDASSTLFKNAKVDEWSKQAIDIMTYKALNTAMNLIVPVASWVCLTPVAPALWRPPTSSSTPSTPSLLTSASRPPTLTRRRILKWTLCTHWLCLCTT